MLQKRPVCSLGQTHLRNGHMLGFTPGETLTLERPDSLEQMNPQFSGGVQPYPLG